MKYKKPLILLHLGMILTAIMLMFLSFAVTFPETTIIIDIPLRYIQAFYSTYIFVLLSVFVLSLVLFIYDKVTKKEKANLSKKQRRFLRVSFIAFLVSVCYSSLRPTKVTELIPNAVYGILEMCLYLTVTVLFLASLVVLIKKPKKNSIE